jgi:hypothetical protein
MPHAADLCTNALSWRFGRQHAFPVLDFASMAANAPGPGYLPQGDDPLFDL